MSAKAATNRLFPTRNDLSADVRERMIVMLNRQLATLTDLYTQTKHSHWNVKGANFWGLHTLFDQLAEGLEEHIDDTAERVTALGGAAKGTARMAAANSRLDEFPDGVHAGLEVVGVLADRYATAGKEARQGIALADEHGDADTADLLTAASRYLDKSLYFLESHLQQDERG
ncbi:MAG TPA: DNA starvation/stationary phase protection protein Dps [Urbifossiella sp.]|jgi:starvation-inducible DNA-binding protein|nr:DNA starvation/stationary phase protection protein Dps [Urbifossiella sp.]